MAGTWSGIWGQGRMGATARQGGRQVAKNDRLNKAAVKIGTALGKADRTAHKVAKAGVAAREELEEIAKQIDALKRQLVKTTKRLKRALA